VSSKQKTPPNRGTVVRAEVKSVRNGEDGPFYVAYPLHDHGPRFNRSTSVTFAAPNWCGEGEPEVNQLVDLMHVRLFRKGWRAAEAHPIVPTGVSA
jgi:hypothetical protein